MAPEQLEGGEADARTDVFALGTVLYEMVTSKKAFEGKSQASLITAIMSSEPPPVSKISTVQTISPAFLDHVVQRCPAKGPDERWQSAGDVGRELQWIEAGSAAGDAPAGPARRSYWRLTAALLAGIVVGALVASFFYSGQEAPATLNPVIRFQMSGFESPTIANRRQFALSPDATHLVYRLGAELRLRCMDQMEETLIRVSGVARAPFFSPDGQWVGFEDGAGLKKVSIRGVSTGRAGPLMEPLSSEAPRGFSASPPQAELPRF